MERNLNKLLEPFHIYNSDYLVSRDKKEKTIVTRTSAVPPSYLPAETTTTVMDDKKDFIIKFTDYGVKFRISEDDLAREDPEISLVRLFELIKTNLEIESGGDIDEE